MPYNFFGLSPRTSGWSYNASANTLYIDASTTTVEAIQDVWTKMYSYTIPAGVLTSELRISYQYATESGGATNSFRIYKNSNPIGEIVNSGTPSFQTQQEDLEPFVSGDTVEIWHTSDSINTDSYIKNFAIRGDGAKITVSAIPNW